MEVDDRKQSKRRKLDTESKIPAKKIWGRTSRKAQMKDTLKILKAGKYFNSKNEEVILDSKATKESVSKVTMYTEVISVPNGNAVSPCIIEVVESDCVDVALKVKREGFNPVVLCMANRQYPGGGYMEGDDGQEENLFRRSNFERFIGPSNDRISVKYPIPDFGTIYAPNVTFFKGSEEDDYRLLDIVQDMSIICAAAYANPKTYKDDNGQQRLPEEVAEKTKKKIEAIFHTALVRKHDSIVLSSFGCGAFRNPPGHVAQLFAEVIEENQFRNRFKRIVFAILDSKKRSNFHPFRTQFETAQ